MLKILRFPLLLVALALSYPVAAVDIEKGKEINGTCAACHSDNGQGGKKGEYPRIAGQQVKYLETQLRNFRSRTRVNIPMFPYTQERELSDEDIKEIAGICAGHFDHYICRRDDNARGRGEDEVPRMLMGALLAAGAEGTTNGRREVKAGAVEIVIDEAEAVERALGMAERDDLVLVFGDKVNRCWKQIVYFRPDGVGGDGQGHRGTDRIVGRRG